MAVLHLDEAREFERGLVFVWGLGFLPRRQQVCRGRELVPGSTPRTSGRCFGPLMNLVQGAVHEGQKLGDFDRPTSVAVQVLVEGHDLNVGNVTWRNLHDVTNHILGRFCHSGKTWLRVHHYLESSGVRFVWLLASHLELVQP